MNGNAGDWVGLVFRSDDTLNRLETMAMMSDVEIPLQAMRAQIASAINIVVQTTRLLDGSRCVTHITEVLGYDPERGYQLGDIFVRRYLGREADGKVVSEFVPTGRFPRCFEMIRALGLDLPSVIYEAAQRNGFPIPTADPTAGLASH